MKRIALIGSPERREIARLRMRLEERSAEPVVLDPRGDPGLELAGGGGSAGSARACGVDLSDCAALYVADLALPSPFVRRDDGSIDPERSAGALRSSRRRLAAWNALLTRLQRRCLVVNPVVAHDLHSLKPWETFVYAREGLPCAETVSTSDPRSVLSLAGGTGTAWVRKGLVGGYGYTEAFVPPGAPAEASAALAAAPILVQERIVGVNVRAFVIGRAVVGAAEVVGASAAATDSRRDTARVRAIAPPPEAAAAAVAAAARWGLAFAAVDFMRDERSGRWLLLECNSAPFFAELEKATGIPVSGALADLLTGRRPRP